MNTACSNQNSLEFICHFIADEIRADKLVPSDILSLATGLIEMTICDLANKDCAKEATSKITTIICQTIKDNRKA